MFHHRKMQLICLLSILLIVIASVAILTVKRLAAHAAASAQATVNVTNSLGTIPATAYGENQAVWDGSLLDSSLPGLISASGTKMQRYPGGSLSDVYHWQSNSNSPNLSYVNPSNNFDAFMNKAQQAGTQPIITVDYGAGTAQEAAGWVQYANKGGPGYNGPVPTYSGGSSTGHTYGIKYWEIGNEIPGDGTYGSKWEYNMHPLGPSTYAHNVVDFSQAMKAVDPTIKTGLVLTTPGSWPDGSTSSSSPSPWNDTVLQTACPSIDFGIIHWYPVASNAAGGGGDPAQGLQTPGQISGMIAKARAKINQYCGSRASSIQIFITETNGGSYNAGSRATGWASALFLSDTYMTFLENGVANVDWWEVHDDLISSGACATGGSPCDPPAGTPFPPYYGLQMLSILGTAGDSMVSSSSSQSLIAVHAVKQANGKLAVLLVNKDPNNSYTVSLGINGYSASSTATVYTYGKNSTKITSASGSASSVTIAPYSLTTLVLSPGTGTSTGTSTSTSTGTINSTNKSTGSMLRSVASNKCLDVAGLSTTNATQVQIWDCWGGVNQQWTLLSNGELQVYGNKCLDVLYHATTAGSKVAIWDCNGGANQQWTLNADGTIVGRESGLCLDVSGGGTANGTAVQIWACSGTNNQKWTRQ